MLFDSTTVRAICVLHDVVEGCYCKYLYLLHW